jgi:hypothetical protein
MSSPREWTLRITAPCDWITANPRSSNRHVRASLVTQWRRAAYERAGEEHLPVGLDYLRIDAEFRFRGRAPVRDRDNLRPTVKAAIDGLGRPGPGKAPGYGLIPDDSDKYLAGTEITIGDPMSHWLNHRGLLILHIKELKR